MDSDQVKEFQKAVGKAAWKLNLDQFAEAINQSPEHDHTRELFKEFSALSRSLNRFDAETLTTIIQAV